MQIYLACDSGNTTLIGAVKDALREMNTGFGWGIVSAVFPPEGLGADTGRTLSNILRIRQADLVILDPSQAGSGAARLNPGALIEYGIVLALAIPPPGASPWNGTLPTPSYRVLYPEDRARSELSPPVNAESIQAYSLRPGSANELGPLVKRLILEKLKEKSEFRVDLA